MSKHVLQEPKANKTVDTNDRADLLAHGSPTREHIDPATGLVPEGLYSGDGHDRMNADVISAANASHPKD